MGLSKTERPASLTNPSGRITDAITLGKFTMVANIIASSGIGNASFPAAAEQIDSFGQPLRPGFTAVIPTFDNDETRALFGRIMSQAELTLRKNPDVDPQSLDAFAATLPQALTDARQVVEGVE